MIDPSLLAYLLASAVKLSGYPPIAIEDLPPVEVLPAHELRAEVCGREEACADLAAVFDSDGYRILIRDDLDLEKAADNSFLVHEMVHVLQHRSRGEAVFASCNDSLRAEIEAYSVQNRYLKREGLLMRFGDGLPFMRCSGEDTGSSRTISLEPVSH